MAKHDDELIPRPEVEGFNWYAGNGLRVSERGITVKPFQSAPLRDDPAGYLASPGLREAVNVALHLGQPLLVTGEPGTGKSQLAHSVAHELELEFLEFHTKTTSTATDLFYRYDALQHFHASRFEQNRSPAERYITFEALGIAILLSNSPEVADRWLPERYRSVAPKRAVVLIDELDKAPRDLPNDILNEVLKMTFTVRETGRQFSVGQEGLRPVLILTSNSEKNLPEPFLRRCVFYHIRFPENIEELRAVVERRLDVGSAFTKQSLDAALHHFLEIRKLPVSKKPATGECLDWLTVLRDRKLDLNDPGHAEALALSYCVLAKDKDDLTRIRTSKLQSR